MGGAFARTIAVLILGLLGAAPAEPEGEWRPIFDGRTLEGWAPKITGHRLGENYRDTFRVADGAIRVSYDGYGGRFAGRFGHLAYKLPLSAFRLRFEYRFSGDHLPDIESWQHSNSGIMFHGQAPETMSLDQKFPVSLEMQLLGADGEGPRPTGNLCTPGTHVVMKGKLEKEHCVYSSSPTFPNGRWVRAELQVDRNGNVRHLIEGVPVLTYGAPQLDVDDPDAKPLLARAGGRVEVNGGYLYLQSEGHPDEFRKIELMELD